MPEHQIQSLPQLQPACPILLPMGWGWTAVLLYEEPVRPDSPIPFLCMKHSGCSPWQQLKQGWTTWAKGLTTLPPSLTCHSQARHRHPIQPQAPGHHQGRTQPLRALLHTPVQRGGEQSSSWVRNRNHIISLSMRRKVQCWCQPSILHSHSLSLSLPTSPPFGDAGYSANILPQHYLNFLTEF